MKKLKITTKITIWYTVFLLILTGCALSVLAYTGNMQASQLAKTRLIDSVSDASEEVESVGENFIIDEDLNFYDDGVYLGVYDGDEELLEGRRPAELTQLPKLNDKYMNTVKDQDGSTWYIYDSCFKINDNDVWVRGIVKDFAEGSTFTFMLKLSAVALPVLVLLAAAGGYIITRRAFRPVRKIIKTVEGITLDGDLSRRIDLDDHQETKDEIDSLADTFNTMFDKVEKSFDEEKQFTSDVSHELRTPLAVIISQSDYALEDKEYGEKALKTINREARRMSGLVNRLLTLARSESGRLKPEIIKLNFSHLCESIVEQQKPLAAEKNAKLTCDIEADVMVSGDEEMLIRIILNLVDNAVKYGGGGCHIRLILKKAEAYACVTVEDDGPGIEAEHMERIWERFYRGDGARSDDGSGLGLSMVKALVKAQGGYVDAKSSPGKGSCFMINIPLAEGK